MDFDDAYTVPEWPRFLGRPKVMGCLRTQPEDFRVDELPQLWPCGEGHHLWLLVEKRGCNTDWVAGQLARAAGCATRDVGFAGLKDRHAVTTQWYSLPCPARDLPAWEEWKIPDVRILQARRHHKKLRRGVLQGNRFKVLVRSLEGDLNDLELRLEQMKLRGLPNYFGPQRFGHCGANVRNGADWLFNGGRLPRAKRSIYVSAVRSFLFNHVLARRLQQNSWDSLLGGEVVMLDGTRSLFLSDCGDSGLQQRCRDGDVHPTGPLPGAGGIQPRCEAAALEAAVLEPYRSLLDALGEARIEGDRRSLRLRVRELNWTLTGERLELNFALPPGAYATTLIDELVSPRARTHLENGLQEHLK